MEFECVQITSYMYQEQLLHSLKISTGTMRVTTVPILLYISVYMKREEPDQDEQQEQDHLSNSLELTQKCLKFSFAM